MQRKAALKTQNSLKSFKKSDHVLHPIILVFCWLVIKIKWFFGKNLVKTLIQKLFSFCSFSILLYIMQWSLTTALYKAWFVFFPYRKKIAKPYNLYIMQWSLTTALYKDCCCLFFYKKMQTTRNNHVRGLHFFIKKKEGALHPVIDLS